MIDSQEIVAIIPARAGSKGIPAKNRTLCAGRPLIEWTLTAYQESKYLQHLIVASDDPIINEIAARYGMLKGYSRDAAVSHDGASMSELLVDCLTWLRAEKIANFNYYCLLQPTSPLRTSAHIDQSIERYFDSPANSNARGVLISVAKVPHYMAPSQQMTRAGDQVLMNANLELQSNSFIRQQNDDDFYFRNGPAIVIGSIDDVLTTNRIYNRSMRFFEMSLIESQDVNDYDDLAICDALLRYRLKVLR